MKDEEAPRAPFLLLAHRRNFRERSARPALRDRPIGVAITSPRCFGSAGSTTIRRLAIVKNVFPFTSRLPFAQAVRAVCRRVSSTAFSFEPATTSQWPRRAVVFMKCAFLRSFAQKRSFFMKFHMDVYTSMHENPMDGSTASRGDFSVLSRASGTSCFALQIC